MQELDCQNTRRLLDAFEDGEIDTVTSLRVQTHLEACQTCAAHQRSRRELLASLKRIREATPPASADLRRHILAESRSPAGAFGKWGRTVSWAAVAAVLTAFFLSFFVQSDVHTSNSDARPFVQNHKGWAAGRAPLELVTSSADEAAVWFEEQLPGLAAPRETPPGYTLVGTRLSVVEGQSVGVLLYEQAGRRISCFVRLDPSPTTEGFDEVVLRGTGFQAGRCRGHQIVSWGGERGSVVVVGELGETSLLAFAEQNAVDVFSGVTTSPPLSQG